MSTRKSIATIASISVFFTIVMVVAGTYVLIEGKNAADIAPEQVFLIQENKKTQEKETTIERIETDTKQTRDMLAAYDLGREHQEILMNGIKELNIEIYQIDGKEKRECVKEYVEKMEHDGYSLTMNKEYTGDGYTITALFGNNLFYGRCILIGEGKTIETLFRSKVAIATSHAPLTTYMKWKGVLEQMQICIDGGA